MIWKQNLETDGSLDKGTYRFISISISALCASKDLKKDLVNSDRKHDQKPQKVAEVSGNGTTYLRQI